jgi:hypothetical protein
MLFFTVSHPARIRQRPPHDHGVQSVKVGCGSVQLVASSEKSWQYFTLLTSHEDKSWLKALAWENMEFICVTFEVSQSAMG